MRWLLPALLLWAYPASAETNRERVDTMVLSLRKLYPLKFDLAAEELVFGIQTGSGEPWELRLRHYGMDDQALIIEFNAVMAVRADGNAADEEHQLRVSCTGIGKEVSLEQCSLQKAAAGPMTDASEVLSREEQQSWFDGVLLQLGEIAERQAGEKKQ